MSDLIRTLAERYGTLNPSQLNELAVRAVNSPQDIAQRELLSVLPLALALLGTTQKLAAFDPSTLADFLVDRLKAVILEQKAPTKT